MNKIKSAFMDLDSNDLIKGLFVAVLAAVFTFLANLIQVPGFDFTNINWGQVLQIAIVAGGSYLTKNMLTTQSGSILGVTSNLH